jgi:hypothetical protein
VRCQRGRLHAVLPVGMVHANGLSSSSSWGASVGSAVALASASHPRRSLGVLRRLRRVHLQRWGHGALS